MSNFWAISLFWVLFLLFIGVALAFILPSLLRRHIQSDHVDRKAANIAIYHDQLAELKADLESGELERQLYDDARLEIEKRLSEDVPVEAAPVAARQTGRGLGLALAGAIPLLAIGIYVVLGNPDAAMMQRSAPPPMAEKGQHDAAPMIAALEARLKKNPDDIAGWHMLARSYGTTGQYGEAARIFAKISELLPGDAGVLADYADTLAMAQGGSLLGKPQELINQALKLNPQEGKALNLAGSAAYQAQDFARAAAYWRSLLQLMSPDDAYANQVRAAIQDAERAGGVAGLDNLSAASPQSAPVKAAETPSGAAAAISGTVSLSGELAGKVAPGDAVFIYAQLPQGPKMPIASLKIEARQLPYRFTLDDSLAMTPNDKLSNHAEVMLSARVSKSGQAMTQSGDLLGRISPVKLGQQDVAIVIDKVLP